MSANNWRTCPKCVQDLEATILKQKAICAYVLENDTAKEYKAAIDRLAEREKVLTDVTTVGHETYREDYEFYLEGTELVWYYGGHCDRCGFSHKVNGRQKDD